MFRAIMTRVLSPPRKFLLSGLGIICLVSLAALLWGCVFEPYKEVLEYDLIAPPRNGSGLPLRMTELRNESSAGMRLQYRRENGRIEKDPYHRWVQPPEQLIAQAVNCGLYDGVSTRTAVVTGSLETFEVDSVSGCFRLKGFFRIGGFRGEHFFLFEVPLEEDTPEGAVRAASGAVAELVQRIAVTAAGEGRP